MEELKYGLFGDKLIYIDDAKKGLACNCLCPHCKGQLVAKKGEKRARHFAHYKIADCDHGTESALHLMAKNIIEQTRKLYVPYIPKTEYDFRNDGQVYVFEKAILEKQLSDSLRGDIVLYSGKSFLNVEIKVTHEVEAAKTVELFNYGIPTVEIDLSDIKNDFTIETVTQNILSGERTRLIYSPKCKAIFAKRILGEWKETHYTTNGTYVKDCPLSGSKAYFFDYSGKGGRNQCHECVAFRNYRQGHSVFEEDRFLCYGCIDGIDFDQIEKILYLEKETNHIRRVKLLMRDGNIIER